MTRRLEQRADPSLKGLRWTLLKDRQRLSAAARADLDTLISQAATKRTARAWLYRQGLRAILDRKQINVVAAMLKQWAEVLRRRCDHRLCAATRSRSAAETARSVWHRRFPLRRRGRPLPLSGQRGVAADARAEA